MGDKVVPWKDVRRQTAPVGGSAYHPRKMHEDKAAPVERGPPATEGECNEAGLRKIKRAGQPS